MPPLKKAEEGTLFITANRHLLFTKLEDVVRLRDIRDIFRVSLSLPGILEARALSNSHRFHNARHRW